MAGFHMLYVGGGKIKLHYFLLHTVSIQVSNGTHVRQKLKLKVCLLLCYFLYFLSAFSITNFCSLFNKIENSFSSWGDRYSTGPDLVPWATLPLLLSCQGPVHCCCPRNIHNSSHCRQHCFICPLFALFHKTITVGAEHECGRPLPCGCCFKVFHKSLKVHIGV